MRLSRPSPALARWFVACGLVLSSKAALANGRLPASNQIAIDAQRPDRVLLRTTFGVLYSVDRGKTWDWVCETALHYGGIQDPMLTFTGDGNIVGATFDGFVRTKNQDVCNFEVAGGNLTNKVFIDLTSRAAAPATIFALSGGYAETDDAGVFLYDSEIFRSDDNAASFVRVGEQLDRKAVYQTIDVAPSNPARVYASGSRGVAEARKGFIAISDDGGVTFRESPIDLAWPNEYAPYIAGVHPTNPDILYVRTAGPPGAPARLFRSNDGGATFSVVLQFQGPMEGFALSTDGSRVWAGGTVDRLHRASTSDHVFTRVSDAQVQCLTWAASELWVCSNEITGYIAGRSKDEGATIEPLLRFKTIRGPIKCPTDSVASSCVKQWPELKLSLGIGNETPDAGRKPDAGANPSNGGEDGGGCATRATRPSDAGLVALTMIAGVAVVASLRRRNRPSREAP